MRQALIMLATALGILASSILEVDGEDVDGEESGSRGRPVVSLVRLADEAISPITARYIQRAIEQAENERAECLVIVLDTPGGIVGSTRDVVKAILDSQVPIAVFIAPPGARAASAGVFITLAAHVAAMAPGTHIGAAHPVQIGGLPEAPPRKIDEENGAETGVKSPVVEKSVNDTVAWARALATLRGRNAEWAAGAVRESLAVPASEALEEGVVDLMSDDLNDLLARIDSREIALPSGAVRLRTADAKIHTVEMWWGERVLSVLASPNVAFLLMIFGVYGILFELYAPGWGVAGTLGIVCLLLGFFGLAVLPINYAGLALLTVAVALFAAEAFFTSYGILTIGGVVCLVLGGTMLIDSPAGFQRVSLSVLVPVALATAGITVFLVGSMVKAQRSRVHTGNHAMILAGAVADEDFAFDGQHYTGTIRTQGEFWTAVSAEPVTAGQVLEIEGRQDLRLLVRAAGGASGAEHEPHQVSASE